MVPRMLPSGERVVKVMPYGTNSLGIKVHSIDDGMDYILTPQGGWMEALGTGQVISLLRGICQCSRES